MGENVSTMIPQQIPTEYQITDKELILLEIMLNPEHRTKSVSEWCRIANCNRSTYYDAMAKPGFMAIYEQKTKDLIKQSVGPVVNTFVREALRGSFQHGKVILEMAGLYSEKSTLELTGEVDISTPAERRARLASMLQQPGIIEGIKAKYQVLPASDEE